MKSYYSFKPEYIIIITLTLMLNVIGIFVVRSASGMSNEITNRQIIGSVIGFSICVAVSFIDYKKILRFSKQIYTGAVILLLAVLFWGAAHNGAGRWIVLPLIGQIQPAEFAKIAVIIFFASYFEKHQTHLSSISCMLRAFLLFAFPAVLIFAEPNLSTTIILFVIFFTIYFCAGLNRKAVALLTGAFALTVAGIVFMFSTEMYEHIPFIKDYQKKRILSFLHPEEYSDSFFQQGNSLMAIGSGGFFGKGLFNTDIGSVKAGNFLIEEETDFIFAIIGEELGFRGSLIIFALYIALLLCILYAGGKAKNLSGSLICAGMAAWIGFQTFTNIAVATAIFPNTGVTLPFFSRGISSLIALYIGIGIVLNVGFQTND